LIKNMEAIPENHSPDSHQNSYTWNVTRKYGKHCSLKLEAWAVGITVGSTEVPGRKGLWQGATTTTAAAAALPLMAKYWVCKVEFVVWVSNGVTIRWPPTPIDNCRRCIVDMWPVRTASQGAALQDCESLHTATHVSMLHIHTYQHHMPIHFLNIKTNNLILKNRGRFLECEGHKTYRIAS
jgi:hypothetical protein